MADDEELMAVEAAAPGPLQRSALSVKHEMTTTFLRASVSPSARADRSRLHRLRSRPSTPLAHPRLHLPCSLPAWVEKYRPSELDELVSQGDIISTVSRLIDAGRLPHLLFYGPPGTGKSAFARCARARMRCLRPIAYARARRPAPDPAPRPHFLASSDDDSRSRAEALRREFSVNGARAQRVR